MEFLAFNERPLWLTIGVFIVSAVVVWRAGTRLAGYADRFSELTGIGGAVVGMVLLGGITSLPEIATSITASLAGNAPLAVNNLVGGVSMQLLVLAVADVVIGKRALSSTVPRPDVLAQSAMNVGLLALVAAAVAAGDVEVFGLGFGAGAVAVLLAYAACIAVSRSMEKGVGWRPAGDGALAEAVGDEAGDEETPEGRPLGRLLGLIALTGLLILIGGFLLTRSGEAIAERTGLGSSFFGAVFLAGATSLPELSSALGAARLNRPQLAIGDVLGGNLFNLMLIFLVDVSYRGGPVLAEVGSFSVFAAALGALLNAVLIIGLVERRDRTRLRMGYDSLTLVGAYIGGLAIMYQLRPEAVGG